MEPDTETFRDRVLGYDITSEQTVDEYCSWIERYFDWHTDNGNGEITEGTLRDFDSELRSDVPLGYRKGAYSYQTRVKAVSAVVKYSEVMHDSDSVATGQVGRAVGDMCHGEEQQFDPHVLDDDETERVLTEHCKTPGCLAARKAGFDLILRASEAMDMRPEDIDWEASTVYVRAKKGSLSKTLSVGDDALDALGDQYDWVTSQFDNPTKLFYDTAMVKGWSPEAWSAHFIRKHHSAGFHAFARHTSIVHHLKEVGFGETFVRARHSHPNMTARYSSVVDIEIPDWV